MADDGKQYDHEPGNGILPQAFPGEQIDACTYRIRPADKSEDAPPEMCIRDRCKVDVLPFLLRRGWRVLSVSFSIHSANA